MRSFWLVLQTIEARLCISDIVLTWLTAPTPRGLPRTHHHYEKGTTMSKHKGDDDREA
jgi:hypothetical protein